MNKICLGCLLHIETNERTFVNGPNNYYHYKCYQKKLVSKIFNKNNGIHSLDMTNTEIEMIKEYISEDVMPVINSTSESIVDLEKLAVTLIHKEISDIYNFDQININEMDDNDYIVTLNTMKESNFILNYLSAMK